MKKILFLAAGLLLLSFFVLPTATTFAAADATCVSNPPSGAIGTVFVITCSGYSPNTGVFAYLVEPTGTALGPHFWGGGAAKTDGSGTVTYAIPSRFGNIVTMAYGQWHIAVEQLGLAKSVVHRGETSWNVTGGTGGVSGAHLETTPYIQHKYVDPSVIIGSGFQPFEMVSLWIEFARGQCATVTLHFPTGNEVDAGGISTFGLGDVKADASGAFSITLPPAAGDNCEGTYHYVARGNASGRGAAAEFILTGNVVHPTIAMQAFPAVQSAAPGNLISFTGSGFRGGEPVSCWVTERNGHTVSVPDTKADSAGSIAFSITTGAINSYYALGIPLSSSEGPLGVWHMTCRGDLSGLEGIAEYTLTGGIVDP